MKNRILLPFLLLMISPTFQNENVYKIQPKGTQRKPEINEDEILELASDFATINRIKDALKLEEKFGNMQISEEQMKLVEYLLKYPKISKFLPSLVEKPLFSSELIKEYEESNNKNHHKIFHNIMQKILKLKINKNSNEMKNITVKQENDDLHQNDRYDKTNSGYSSVINVPNNEIKIILSNSYDGEIKNNLFTDRYDATNSNSNFLTMKDVEFIGSTTKSEENNIIADSKNVASTKQYVALQNSNINHSSVTVISVLEDKNKSPNILLKEDHLEEDKVHKHIPKKIRIPNIVFQATDKKTQKEEDKEEHPYKDNVDNGKIKENLFKNFNNNSKTRTEEAVLAPENFGTKNYKIITQESSDEQINNEFSGFGHVHKIKNENYIETNTIFGRRPGFANDTIERHYVQKEENSKEDDTSFYTENHSDAINSQFEALTSRKENKLNESDDKTTVTVATNDNILYVIPLKKSKSPTLNAESQAKEKILTQHVKSNIVDDLEQVTYKNNDTCMLKSTVSINENDGINDNESNNKTKNDDYIKVPADYNKHLQIQNNSVTQSDKQHLSAQHEFIAVNIISNYLSNSTSKNGSKVDDIVMSNPVAIYEEKDGKIYENVENYDLATPTESNFNYSKYESTIIEKYENEKLSTKSTENIPLNKKHNCSANFLTNTTSILLNTNREHTQHKSINSFKFLLNEDSTTSTVSEIPLSQRFLGEVKDSETTDIKSEPKKGYFIKTEITTNNYRPSFENLEPQGENVENIEKYEVHTISARTQKHHNEPATTPILEDNGEHLEEYYYPKNYSKYSTFKAAKEKNFAPNESKQFSIESDELELNITNYSDEREDESSKEKNIEIKQYHQGSKRPKLDMFSNEHNIGDNHSEHNEYTDNIYEGEILPITNSDEKLNNENVKSSIKVHSYEDLPKSSFEDGISEQKNIFNLNIHAEDNADTISYSETTENIHSHNILSRVNLETYSNQPSTINKLDMFSNDVNNNPHAKKFTYKNGYENSPRINLEKSAKEQNTGQRHIQKTQRNFDEIKSKEFFSNKQTNTANINSESNNNNPIIDELNSDNERTIYNARTKLEDLHENNENHSNLEKTSHPANQNRQVLKKYRIEHDSNIDINQKEKLNLFETKKILNESNNENTFIPVQHTIKKVEKHVLTHRSHHENPKQEEEQITIHNPKEDISKKMPEKEENILLNGSLDKSHKIFFFKELAPQEDFVLNSTDRNNNNKNTTNTSNGNNTNNSTETFKEEKHNNNHKVKYEEGNIVQIYKNAEHIYSRPKHLHNYNNEDLSLEEMAEYEHKIEKELIRRHSNSFKKVKTPEALDITVKYIPLNFDMKKHRKQRINHALKVENPYDNKLTQQLFENSNQAVENLNKIRGKTKTDGVFKKPYIFVQDQLETYQLILKATPSEKKLDMETPRKNKYEQMNPEQISISNNKLKHKTISTATTDIGAEPKKYFIEETEIVLSDGSDEQSSRQRRENRDQKLVKCN